MAEIDPTAKVKLTTLAKVLGISISRAGQLTSEGVIARPGALTLADGVQAYVRHRLADQRSTAQSAAQARALDAKTRLIEQRIAEKDGRLISLQEHRGLIAELCGIFREGVESLAARVTRDLALRHQIEREVDQVFQRITSKLESAISETEAAIARSDNGASAN